MKNRELKANLLLLLATFIWGTAFIAQRVVVESIGSFAFTGIRFLLGAVSLLPVLFFMGKRSKRQAPENGKSPNERHAAWKETAKCGFILGSVLFVGASLQQIGLVDTTAGKAAFITGFYIVLVPIYGIFLKHRIYKSTWAAAVFAIAGLYLLGVNDDFTVSRGDMLVLAGSFFWAADIILIHRYSQRMDALLLSFAQYVACSLLCLTCAFIFEDVTIASIKSALIPILYGGLFSVGIAYTLQVLGQRDSRPSHAAVIFSLESVFAAAAGMLILGETMDARAYAGCMLMLAGFFVSQFGTIYGDRFKQFLSLKTGSKSDNEAIEKAGT